MSEIIIKHMDEEGNEVPEEKAERTNIAEYDENGDRIREIYVVHKRNRLDDDENIDDVVVDPESDLIKNNDFTMDKYFERFFEEEREKRKSR